VITAGTPISAGRPAPATRMIASRELDRAVLRGCAWRTCWWAWSLAAISRARTSGPDGPAARSSSARRSERAIERCCIQRRACSRAHRKRPGAARVGPPEAAGSRARSVYHPGMSLARAWTRQLFGASGAAVLAPATIVVALAVPAVGGGAPATASASRGLLGVRLP